MPTDTAALLPLAEECERAGVEEVSRRYRAIDRENALLQALRDIGTSEPIPDSLAAWKWCRDVAKDALRAHHAAAADDGEAGR